MARYLLRRVGQAALVLVGVSAVVFVLVRLGGDPAALLLPPDVSVEELQRFRRAMGFDDPLPVQFGRFLRGAAGGDFGRSLRHEEPAMGLVLARLPATAFLAATAMVVSLAVAVPLGVAAAVRRGSWLDRAAMSAALVGQSLPVFWVGIMLILVFAVRWRWLPAFGIGTPAHLVLPAVTLAGFLVARIARLTRAGMVEALREDYVRTARAKGLPETAVVWKHALKNAALPLVTIVGLDLGTLLGGAVITETVFAWPGVGRLAVQAIANRDFPVVQAAVFAFGVVFVAVNLLVDLCYAALDPRARLA
jgi:peptide/nickel transport system permease protein